MYRRILIVILNLITAHCVYATTLGHLTVVDPVMGLRDIVYEKIDGYAVVEGDILLKKLNENPRPVQALIVMKLGGGRWLQGTIPFELASNLPFATQLAVLDAIHLWESSSNLKFIELTEHNRNQYPDYLLFEPSNDGTCSSFVGQQGGMQMVKLSPQCRAMNIAHEIGHAAGLWHEQSRADRDTYIKIQWENIEDKYQYNFNQHVTDGQDFGEYDYQSIMHYTAYAFSKNGKKTIIPLQENVEIGQRDHLSHKDIAAVNAMYPRN